MTVAARLRSRREAEDARFVLTAAQIPAWIQQEDGAWSLLVDPDHAERAARELGAWEAERSEPRPAAPRVDGARRAGAWATAILWVAVLAWFHLMSIPRRDGWFAAGASDGPAVRAGAWERTVTALTLHADLEHVAGNAFFGALFLFALATETGGGAAVLLLLLGGAGGNLLNAWWLQGDRSAVGASTAVFAVLGALAGVRIVQLIRGGRGIRTILLPLAGVAAMLAWLGVSGGETDVGAHLLGSAAGVPLGLLAHPAAERWKGHVLQAACGALATGLLVAAWVVALH